jgi:hypothetical protein
VHLNQVLPLQTSNYNDLVFSSVGLFGLKRDEVTGGWRKVHNEELHNLYSSASIITYNDQVKEDEMGRACSTEGGKECV